MKNLIPHLQQRLQAEIERALLREKPENSEITKRDRTICKSDIEQLSINFDRILTGQVVVE